MSEIVTADRWVNGRLRGDALLKGLVKERIFAYPGPQTDPPLKPPYVLFQFQGGRDLVVLGGVRVWSDMTYLVRGVTETRGLVGLPQQIAKRIDMVLDGGAGSNVDGIVYSCVREQPFFLPEVFEGRVYRHLGGIYRIYARGA